MSAHKRTTVMVDEEQYRRLHETEMRNRFLEKEIPKISKELRAHTHRSLDSSIQRMESRQQDYHALLSGLQDEIRDQAYHNQQQLQERQNAFLQQIEAHAGVLWEDLSADLAAELLQQREELADVIHAQRTEYMEDYSRIAARMEDFVESSQQKREIANYWLENTRVMYAFIDEHLDVYKFARQEFHSLGKNLQHASMNYENGMVEAALSMAQMTFTRLASLRERLEMQTLQWEALFQATQERVVRLNMLLEASEEIPAVDLSGNELEQVLDTDQWTEGKHKALQDEVNLLLEQMTSHRDLFDFEILKNLLENTLPAFEQQLDGLILSARVSVLNAHMRVNVADLVLQALQQQGYRYVDNSAHFEQDDMHETFFSNACALDGSEVVIQVDPVNGYDLQFDLHLHSLDQSRFTHHELRHRMNEINQSLIANGLQVGTTKTMPENREILPIKQRRQEQEVYRGNQYT